MTMSTRDALISEHKGITEMNVNVQTREGKQTEPIADQIGDRRIREEMRLSGNLKLNIEMEFV